MPGKQDVRMQNGLKFVSSVEVQFSRNQDWRFCYQ